jgi:glycine/sarcosine N-methyltransferase
VPEPDDATRHPSSVVDFYDGLAANYHLIYADHWRQSLIRQGQALQHIIRSRFPDARDVLDCSCGIGTQAIGLALLGYRVTGTDISQRSLQRAADEAAQLGACVRLAAADFRDLSKITGDFDVVISCDNAIPHLLEPDDVDRALGQMYAKARRGGLVVVSTRDYDQALRERPAVAPPLDVPGPPRTLVLRLHEWDSPDSRLYTVRFLILTQQATGWTVAEHSTRYRAITSTELADSARLAGFDDVDWLTADEAQFHQPVMIARRS